MTMKRWFGWLLFVAIAPVVLSGCLQPPVDPLILDPLSDTEPACWLEICPGTTTADEAEIYLRAYPGISISGKDIEGTRNPTVSWVTSPSATAEGVVSGYFYSDPDDGVVTHVFLFADDRVSLEDVVAKFGEPPQVLAAEVGAETPWLWLDLRYPDRGLIVTHTNRAWTAQRADTVTVWRDMRVSELHIFAANRAESLEPGLIGAPDKHPYVPWPGWDAELEVVDLTG